MNYILIFLGGQLNLILKKYFWKEIISVMLLRHSSVLNYPIISSENWSKATQLLIGRKYVITYMLLANFVIDEKKMEWHCHLHYLSFSKSRWDKTKHGRIHSIRRFCPPNFFLGIMRPTYILFNMIFTPFLVGYHVISLIHFFTFYSIVDIF